LRGHGEEPGVGGGGEVVVEDVGSVVEKGTALSRFRLEKIAAVVAAPAAADMPAITANVAFDIFEM
jgi:hypothetical protein